MTSAPKNQARGPGTIDSAAREALRRIVRLLTHRGCSAREIEEEVALVCKQMPQEPPPQVTNARLLEDSGHVLTLWFSDPAYTSAEGALRPLPLSGAAPSIEALVRRVNPDLDVHQVLQTLRRGGALRELGSQFVARRRDLIFRDSELLRDTLGSLFGLLMTLEHNRWGPRDQPRLELFSVNRSVPRRAIGEVERKTRPIADQMLRRADEAMHDIELEAAPGEATVEMGLGVYEWILDPQSDESPGSNAATGDEAPTTQPIRRSSARRSTKKPGRSGG